MDCLMEKGDNSERSSVKNNGESGLHFKFFSIDLLFQLMFNATIRTWFITGRLFLFSNGFNKGIDCISQR